VYKHAIQIQDKKFTGSKFMKSKWLSKSDGSCRGNWLTW